MLFLLVRTVKGAEVLKTDEDTVLAFCVCSVYVCMKVTNYAKTYTVVCKRDV